MLAEGFYCYMQFRADGINTFNYPALYQPNIVGQQTVAKFFRRNHFALKEI